VASFAIVDPEVEEFLEIRLVPLADDLLNRATQRVAPRQPPERIDRYAGAGACINATIWLAPVCAMKQRNGKRYENPLKQRAEHCWPMVAAAA